jgi:hypothetical protein
MLLLPQFGRKSLGVLVHVMQVVAARKQTKLKNVHLDRGRRAKFDRRRSDAHTNYAAVEEAPD